MTPAWVLTASQHKSSRPPDSCQCRERSGEAFQGHTGESQLPPPPNTHMQLRSCWSLAVSYVLKPREPAQLSHLHTHTLHTAHTQMQTRRCARTDTHCAEKLRQTHTHTLHKQMQADADTAHTNSCRHTEMQTHGCKHTAHTNMSHTQTPTHGQRHTAHTLTPALRACHPHCGSLPRLFATSASSRL